MGKLQLSKYVLVKLINLNWSHISPLQSISGTSVSRDISRVGIPHVNNSPAIDSKRAVNSNLCIAAAALWSVPELAKLNHAHVANFTADLFYSVADPPLKYKDFT